MSCIFNLTVKYCFDSPMMVENDRNMQLCHNEGKQFCSKERKRLGFERSTYTTECTLLN